MKNERNDNAGMTLPELVLAVIMLSAFTGITVMVTQFTSSFFQTANEGAKGKFVDVINDHITLNKAFDSIVETLSEPGIDKNFIEKLNCTDTPGSEWNKIIKKIVIPESYNICIKKTILTESKKSDLINEDGQPGIYILYSSPKNRISFNVVPVRRIFCRPKPYCIKEKKSF